MEYEALKVVNYLNVHYPLLELAPICKDIMSLFRQVNCGLYCFIPCNGNKAVHILASSAFSPIICTGLITIDYYFFFFHHMF